MALDLGQRLRGAVTENLNLKILSLIFALVLYSIVHEAQDFKRTIEVNVNTQEPPDSADKVLVTPAPPHIRVTLRGPRSMINDLNTDNIGAVKLDLRSGTESRVLFEPSMVPVPPGVKVESIDPPGIELSWEDRIVRPVPIQVSVAGTPSPGFVVKGVPSADPPAVNARGPKSEASVLQYVRADPFDINGLAEGRHSRTLALDRPRGRVTYELPNATVWVDIVREVSEHTFTKTPVVVVGPPKAKTLPAEVDVRVRCPSEIVRILRADQVVPRVQVPVGAEHGSEAHPVDFSLPQCEVSITPPSVVVKW